MPETASSLWDRVDEIIARAPSVGALRWHGVHLLAARQRRALGRPVPAELRADERRAAMVGMAAPILLERVRAVCDGPLVLMKGPEAAACYPDPAVRAFNDLDLLVEDAPELHRTLLAHGFVEMRKPALRDDHHHLQPLALPGLPAAIELHRQPSFVPGLRPPATRQLLELTQPSATRVDGVLAPTSPAHALLLAAHGWRHEPLGRLVDLIDVAATLKQDGRGLAAELAREWGCERMWHATIAAADGLLLSDRAPVCLRVWARHLPAARERTVLERHLRDVLAPARALPRVRGLGAATVALTRVGRRAGDERWADKLRRTRLALGHAFVTGSEHERTLILDRRSRE